MRVTSRETFKGYLEEIHRVFKQHQLIDVLREGDYRKKSAEHISHLRSKYNKNGQVDFQEDDLLHIAREARFAIANTIFLYEIGLAKFQITQSQYGPVGGLFTTELDNRFFYFVDDVFMRLYNFWNRVANFLNIFFQVERDSEKVYFSPLIDELATNVGTDQHFQSLQQFRNKDYKDIINRRRRKIVHRKCSTATYFETFSKNVQNPEELSRLQQERDELPQFFVVSYHRMIQGLDEMLALIKGNVK